MNYFKVTFQYSETTYCTNIAIAENETKVNEHYKKYAWHNISEAKDYEVLEAKRKGMPIVEIA